MKMTPEEYGRMAKKASPGSPFPKNCLLAFLIGGLICTLGQVCIELYQYAGLEQEVASTAASVTLVFLAVLLSGFGVYDNIAKYAGAGTLVPITPRRRSNSKARASCWGWAPRCSSSRARSSYTAPRQASFTA